MSNAYLGQDLITAAETGNLPQVEALLQQGANPNTQHLLHRNTPLTIAATRGHLEIAKLLVRHGADINLIAGDAPTTAIESAAIAGKTETVEWLLEMGAKVPTGAEADDLIRELLKYNEHHIINLLQNAMKKQAAS